MYFQMGWHDGVGNEYGYSPRWAIATDAAAATTLYQDMKEAGTDMALTAATAVYTPMPTPFVDVDPTTSSIPSSTGSDSSSTSPASSSTSTASPTSTSTDMQANASNANTHGSLAQSALIGIIVGCVAALALLLLGAFLCLRKRRQQKSRRNGAPHFLERDTQQDLILAEKEAHAAGAGPGTPYSEVYDDAAAGDGPRRAALAEAGPRRGSVAYSSLRNVAAVGAGAGGESLAAAADTHSLSVVSLHEPYADEQPQEQQFHRTTSHNTAAASDDLVVSPGSEVDHEQSPLAAAGGRMGSSSVGGAGTPQLGPPTRVLRADTPGGKSISDYLHEDGMTEDQIRRLEEEERALDEAIERAERAAGGRAGAAGT